MFGQPGYIWAGRVPSHGICVRVKEAFGDGGETTAAQNGEIDCEDSRGALDAAEGGWFSLCCGKECPKITKDSSTAKKPDPGSFKSWLVATSSRITKRTSPQHGAAMVEFSPAERAKTRNSFFREESGRCDHDQ